jgi:hypothetical protein
MKIKKELFALKSGEDDEISPKKSRIILSAKNLSDSDEKESPPLKIEQDQTSSRRRKSSIMPIMESI